MHEIIEHGYEAQDQIELEDEAHDPRALILHNYINDAARRRAETKRRLNFPDLHTPPMAYPEDDAVETSRTRKVEKFEDRPGPSGVVTSTMKPTSDPKAKKDDEMDVDADKENKVSNRKSLNSNGNNSNNHPDTMESDEYDIDIPGAPGQIITMAVRRPNRSTPTVGKAGVRSEPQSMEIRMIETGIKKSTLKSSASSGAIKNLAKFVKRGRRKAQDIIDSSFRSDNATSMCKLYLISFITSINIILVYREEKTTESSQSTAVPTIVEVNNLYVL